ncbi:TnsA-like heteromeric transposase endonuclease subunit [Streptomyces sp. H10-C2]|uniref:TnsA-like heteromeric transposase endonuclease subunit n=1 Tax=Streptomyces sp. H10-C2 TaxID=3046210 RepID=UPI0024BA8A05|nr:TnsA-like heteromeric transposase endonuclease subunit [Streptomyces sp. H10-C2]MDJ0374682.1 TnsA-like heteromeric transposase endonuclease subunit [Streptomyces sp. H10-C2]
MEQSSVESSVGSRVLEGRVASPLWSDACGWEDLALICGETDLAVGRGMLNLDPGWSARWSATWKFGKVKRAGPVDGLNSVPLAGCVPWRGFTWRTRQFHRPGLEPMVSTGRQHAFESHREDQFVVMADFAGETQETLSQPFLLNFEGEGGRREHIPDFLLLSDRGRWLVDIRPAGRMDDDDLMKFAATSEVALMLGWGYAVVTGWRPLTWRNVDLLYSRRRPMQDRLGLKPMLLQAARAAQAVSEPITFRELADTFEFPALARPVILHLLWHRQFGVDLTAPFRDSSVLRVAKGAVR